MIQKQNIDQSKQLISK